MWANVWLVNIIRSTANIRLANVIPLITISAAR